MTTAFVTAARSGVWAPERRFHVTALFGDVTIDLREALLQTGITELQMAVSGSIARIIVPPGLPVELDLQVVLSSVRRDPAIAEQPTSEHERSVRVVGHTWLSKLSVTQRR